MRRLYGRLSISVSSPLAASLTRDGRAAGGCLVIEAWECIISTQPSLVAQSGEWMDAMLAAPQEPVSEEELLKFRIALPRGGERNRNEKEINTKSKF